MAAPLLPADPRHLGPYWLAGRLGAGGQGVVYEGYDADGARVAVKALHAGAEDDAYRSLLRKEAEALGRVASFCTARVLGFDLDHTPPYLVSEFVAGPDLQARVERQGPYGPDELLRLGIGIATALASIHGAGVVHRDLKPANVLLGPDGPRVIDFGIARTEEMSRSVTGLKGTPRWMAPELFQGGRATAAVDLWAWGAIMVYAATGRPLVPGDSLPSIIHGVLNAEPELDALPPSLRPAVELALSRDPARRPGARELLDGLIGDAPAAGGTLEAGRDAASALPAPEPAPGLDEIAERAYASLDPEARAAVPSVLLRMVGGDLGTFRSVARAELQDAETPPAALDRAVGALVGAGLVVHDGGRLSLAAPALVRAWPRLRAWAAEEAPVLAAHHGLADAARRWQDHGRRPGDLLHGTALDEAVTGAVAGRRHLTLSLLERAFLDGSVAGARRRSRNRGLLSAALGVLLVLATGTAGVAVVQGERLEERNATVSRQRDDALGAQLAAAAVSQRRVDPVTARRLAIAAGALSPESFEARSALVTLYNQWEQDSYAPPNLDTASGHSFDDTGRLLAYAQGNDVKVIEVDSHKVVSSFSVEGAPVVRQHTGLSLSGDGTVVSVLHEDGAVELYDVATGRPRPTRFKVTEPYVELDHGGTRMLTMERKRASVRDTATGKTLLERPYHFNVSFLSRNGILVGSRDASLEFWDVAAKKRIRAPRLDLGKEQITNLAASPDGKSLALTAGEKNVWVIRLETGEARSRSIPRMERYGSLRFSPDGRYLTLGGTVWDLSSDQDAPALRYSGDDCYTRVFGPDGRTLRCVDSRGHVNVLSLHAIQDAVRLSDRDYNMTAVLSADGSAVAAQSSQSLEIFDPLTRKRLGGLPIVGLESDLNYTFSPDGSLLADARRDGRIDVWDVRAGTKKATLATGRRLVIEQPIAFSPDGTTLATLTFAGEKSTVLDLWDVASGRLRATSNGVEAKDVLGSGFNLYGDPKILFSADGRTVVSAVDQGLVETATGRRLKPPAALDSAQAISPRGLIAATEERTVQFWDAAALTPGESANLGAVPSPMMAFSADGLLAVSDGTARIRLYDVALKRSLGIPLTGHYVPAEYDSISQATSLAFSKGSTHILSTDSRGRLRAHLIDPAQIRTALCTRVGPLPETDWKTYLPSLPYRPTC